MKSFLESCTVGHSERESTSAATVAAGGHGAMERNPDDDGEAGARQSARPAPRPQVDMDVLRQRMNSYRQVSVQAVEKALAAHMLKKARAGLFVRRIVLMALLLTSTFVVVAHLAGTVGSTSLIWLMGLASAASAAEMIVRIREIRRLRSQAEELADEESSQSRRPLRPGPAPGPAPGP